MAGNSPQFAEQDEADWRQLQRQLGDIAQLAKSDAPFRKVAGEMLESIVEMLAAEGGAVWLRNESDSADIECQVRLGSPADDVADDVRQQWHATTAQTKEFQVFSTASGTSPDASSESSSSPLHLFHPILIDQDVVGLLEVIQRPLQSAAALRGNRRLLAMMSELIADLRKRRLLRRLAAAESRLGEFRRLVDRVHSSLDLRTVAYQLVNQGRNYIGCDRVSVAVRRGRSFRVVAISNVPTVERRSNWVRCLEKLIAQVAKYGEPFAYAEDVDALPSTLANPLSNYLDQAHSRILHVIPLRTGGEEDKKPGEVIAALVIEQFTAQWEASHDQRAADVANVGATSLGNALRYFALPTLPLARTWRRRPAGAWTKLAVAAAGVCLAAALMTMIPMDFDVRAEGELQPTGTRHIFAPLDGQITQLAVRDGDRVEQGDLLLQLHSAELDLETQRAQGEFDTTHQRLAAIETTLLQANGGEAKNAAEADRLAAEREELLQMQASQREQLELLHQEREKLTVRSPIRGTVLTWDLEQLLRDRPVQRGQALLSVAQFDGKWTAELRTPDDRIGYVQEAMRDQEIPPSVTFELATDRGRVYAGRISQIATRTESDASGRAFVRVSVSFEAPTTSDFRPGATVLARIRCGRRPIGYVYFHDLIEASRGWISF